MKSVVIDEPGSVRLNEIAEPELKSDEVLLGIQYIGLCGSDLSAYRGLSPLVTYPRIPGHEVSGIIVNKGAAVPETFQIGDKVSANPYTSCGVCPACRLGRLNTCEFNQTLGVQRDGALSQYFAISYNKILKSNKLTAQEFSLVEPLSVGYHAANRGQVTEIDTVLVIGCGMIGIGAIVAALRKGATVIAIDPDDEKLELVKSFGVKYTINANEGDIAKRVKDITNGEGANVCIEAVGLASTYVLAVDAAAFAGRVVYIGYAKKEVKFNTSLFVKKELTICGSRNALFEFTPVIQMLEERLMPFEKLISKIYPLNETPFALEEWNSRPGDFIKILIDVKVS
ncbi:MAG: zinc-binding alcohol dehydrogenase family protein [Ginsengibacter sp.]